MLSPAKTGIFIILGLRSKQVISMKNIINNTPPNNCNRKLGLKIYIYPPLYLSSKKWDVYLGKVTGISSINVPKRSDLPKTGQILSQSVLNQVNPLNGQEYTNDDKYPSTEPWEIFTQGRIFSETESLVHQRTDGNQW